MTNEKTSGGALPLEDEQVGSVAGGQKEAVYYYRCPYCNQKIDLAHGGDRSAYTCPKCGEMSFARKIFKVDK